MITTHPCVLGGLEDAKLFHCAFASDCGVRMSRDFFLGVRPQICKGEEPGPPRRNIRPLNKDMKELPALLHKMVVEVHGIQR